MNRYMIIQVISVIVCFAVIAAGIYLTYTPSGRSLKNSWTYSLHKVDDSTLYRTRKDVEDTCRAMIASYTADRLKYEQYASSSNLEWRGWGEQAKIRANQTAATYNNYILKNTYVFNGNIPHDILMELEYL